jgi:hypothetical protein
VRFRRVYDSGGSPIIGRKCLLDRGNSPPLR